ncbi:MAG: lytic transglycosylase domain-containing protein [Candidatus Magnetominusculus sp. LBB02]|nr:lytic transglycosylase domain-containing protein [Candidatus Magnetominusculus sp. LBB02]
MFGRIEKRLLKELEGTGTNQPTSARSSSVTGGDFKTVLNSTVTDEKRKNAVPTAIDPTISAMESYLSLDKIDDTNLFPDSEKIFPSTGFKTDVSSLMSDRNSSMRQMSKEGRVAGGDGRWNSNSVVSKNQHKGQSTVTADSLFTSKETPSYNAETSGDDTKSLPMSSKLSKYEDYINEAASTYGLDPALIKAVIVAESGGNTDARSRSGARGLMQLMPRTAADLGVTNSYDPKQNIDGGSRYLKQLLDKYSGNVHQALAAYNWGMGNLDRRPYAIPQQTKNYVAKVESYYRNYSADAS